VRGCKNEREGKVSKHAISVADAELSRRLRKLIKHSKLDGIAARRAAKGGRRGFL
jgi:hypothetical protein